MRHGDFRVLLEHAGHQAIAADIIDALQTAKGWNRERRSEGVSIYTSTFSVPEPLINTDKRDEFKTGLEFLVSGEWCDFDSPPGTR